MQMQLPQGARAQHGTACVTACLCLTSRSSGSSAGSGRRKFSMAVLQSGGARRHRMRLSMQPYSGRSLVKNAKSNNAAYVSSSSALFPIGHSILESVLANHRGWGFSRVDGPCCPTVSFASAYCSECSVISWLCVPVSTRGAPCCASMLFTSLVSCYDTLAGS
jgi:hypothetical protein